MRIEITSPLSPEECAARLLAAIDGVWAGQWFGSKPAIGRVSTGRVVHLRKRLRHGFRNSFQTLLSGSFQPHEKGAVFLGTAGKHPLVLAFTGVWFVILSLFLAIALMGWLQGRGGAGPVIVSVLMLVCGTGIVWLGAYLARHDEHYLVEFVARAIQSNDANQSTAAQTEAPLVAGAVAEFLRSREAINKAKQDSI